MKAIGLVPELLVSDIKKSLAFYMDLLGFKILVGSAEEHYVHLIRVNAEIMLEQIGGKWHNWVTKDLEYPLGRGLNLRIEVENANLILEILNKNDMPIFIPVEEKWYRHGEAEHGNRQFGVMDPDGYLLRIYQDLGVRNANWLKL